MLTLERKFKYRLTGLGIFLTFRLLFEIRSYNIYEIKSQLKQLLPQDVEELEYRLQAIISYLNLQNNK